MTSLRLAGGFPRPAAARGPDAAPQAGRSETFLVKFPLGLRGGHVLLPKGLIQGQRLNEILRRLTLPVARITSFDDLPTRFRAVATDLENGEAVMHGLR